MTTKQSESYDKLFDVLSKSYIIDGVSIGEFVQVKNQKPIWVEEDGTYTLNLMTRDLHQDMKDLESGKITYSEFRVLRKSDQVYFNNVQEVQSYLQQ
jgi:hypothetical protein